jgi:hypothetical protein
MTEVNLQSIPIVLRNNNSSYFNNSNNIEHTNRKYSVEYDAG